MPEKYEAVMAKFYDEEDIKLVRKFKASLLLEGTNIRDWVKQKMIEQVQADKEKESK